MSLEAFPEELRNWPRPQWVSHNAAKELINPHTGRLASVSDPSTWGTPDQVFAAVCAGIGVGGGFVLTDDDPFAFIDLDVKPGEHPTEEQKAILAYLAPSYAEWSPSGRGLHIIDKGSVPSGRRRGNIEL